MTLPSKEQAIYQWFAQFGTVYAESVMPVMDRDEIDYPYGTYELTTDDFGHPVAITFNWWERTPSLKPSADKTAEIEAALGRSGVFIPCAGGGIYIVKNSPFARHVSDDSDKMIRRVIYNIGIEYIT